MSPHTKLIMIGTFTLVLIGSSPASFSAAAQTAPQKSPAGAEKTPVVSEPVSPLPTATPPPPEPTPYVKDVYRIDKQPDDREAKNAGLGDIIIVSVVDLQKLLDQADCKTADGKDVPDCTKDVIVPYLEGRAIKGLVPESGAPIPQEGTLRFHLERTDDSDEAWADLLGAPPVFSYTESEGSLFIRPMKISVGLQNKHAIPSTQKLQFVRIHRWLFWLGSSALIGILLALIIVARKSNLLRDDNEPVGENLKGEETSQAPYSLGRCQMAFWFLLIITSFLFIFVITWQLDVTEQALVLMGISAATAMGAVIVDANKSNQSDENLADAASLYATRKTERLQLEARINELRPKVLAKSATNAEAEEFARSTARLKEVKSHIRKLSTVSQGILNDLLTDVHGYSFHRFQIFVWTLVLGFIFLYGVYTRLAMPTFSATLLAVLGISGATYIGFKIPEKQEPAVDTTASPAGPGAGGAPAGGGKNP